MSSKYILSEFICTYVHLVNYIKIKIAFINYVQFSFILPFLNLNLISLSLKKFFLLWRLLVKISYIILQQIPLNFMTFLFWMVTYFHSTYNSKKKLFNSMLLLLLLSRFSHVRLSATPQTAAHQAPPSLGFSREEHWNGLPFPSPMHESKKWK